MNFIIRYRDGTTSLYQTFGQISKPEGIWTVTRDPGEFGHKEGFSIQLKESSTSGRVSKLATVDARDKDSIILFQTSIGFVSTGTKEKSQKQAELTADVFAYYKQKGKSPKPDKPKTEKPKPSLRQRTKPAPVKQADKLNEKELRKVGAQYYHLVGKRRIDDILDIWYSEYPAQFNLWYNELYEQVQVRAKVDGKWVNVWTTQGGKAPSTHTMYMKLLLSDPIYVRNLVKLSHINKEEDWLKAVKLVTNN